MTTKPLAGGLGRSTFLLCAAALFLSACGNGRDAPLEGQRETLGGEVVAATSVDGVAALTGVQADAPALSLAAAQTNANWTHKGGSATHRIAHPALAATPAPLFSTNIGAGNSRRARITADPVVVGGVVYTLDARSTVAATRVDGTPAWSRDLTPLLENSGHASGGGLAFGNDTLFVTTGFGELLALDPATGGELWVQDLDASGGAAPTYFDGRVYVAARDSMAWVIDAESGRIEWQVSGTPSGSGLVGGPGAAVTDTLAIFPFPSGELVATFRQGGLRRWDAAILGNRTGAAYARITDIAGDPVVAGNRVYAANQGGRMVALDIDSGARAWTANAGSYSPPLVAGGSVFIVSDQNALMRLDASSGATLWSVALPLYTQERERRKKEIFAHRGPVLAGGRLWVASSDDVVRGFDPRTGTQVASLALPGGAASAPVVAGQTMYVVSARGQLHAFR